MISNELIIQQVNITLSMGIQTGSDVSLDIISAKNPLVPRALIFSLKIILVEKINRHSKQRNCIVYIMTRDWYIKSCASAHNSTVS